MNQIVAQRDQDDEAPGREQRPTMEELAAGAWFEPVRTESWRVDRAERTAGGPALQDLQQLECKRGGRHRQAAEDLGGRVTEHYRFILHLLRRNEQPSSVDART